MATTVVIPNPLPVTGGARGSIITVSAANTGGGTVPSNSYVVISYSSIVGNYFGPGQTYPANNSGVIFTYS